MPSYRDQGIVLRTHKIADYDRVIVFATEQHGEVRAVANGVRKPTSRFGGRLEPFCHVAVQLHKGRGELQRVNQVETVDHFKSIRTDLDRLAKAATLCEMVDQMSHGRSDGKLYRMLLGALRALERRDAAVIVGAFALRVLAEEGFGMQVDSCATCDSRLELVSFDPSEGGVMCRDHRRGLPVSEPARSLMAMIVGGRLADALDEPESATTHEVDAIARAAIEHHLERRLRSVTVLTAH